ncbi:Fanconi anemia group B protein [Aplochiton taeniatus]
MEFKLPYLMREPVFILQGPTVLWTFAGDLFYTSLQAREVKQIPIKLSPCLVGQLTLPQNTGEIFILGVQTTSIENQAKSAGKCETRGYIIENGQVFDGTLILPHAYTSITRCILVVSAEKTDHVLITVVAATSNNQLVYFVNGCPKVVCQLPFKEPEDIQIVNTGRNGCPVCRSASNQGHVCTYGRESFQVASCWSDVSYFLVDDFLSCGTDQMILVFGDQSPAGHPLDNFLITDLCGTAFSGDREGLNTSDPAQDNYLLTVQALESRLQSGLTMLQELQRDLKVKERVLLQSAQALAEMVSVREHALTQCEQEGLVALWDEDNDEAAEAALNDKMQVMPYISSPPRVQKLWHRVVGDHLVVGVTFPIDGTIPVDGVSLSVLTETGQSPVPVVIQTRSQASWSPTLSPPAHPEPAAKRSRPDGASAVPPPPSLALTAVTQLSPLLTSGSVKCPVMLHYIPTAGSAAASSLSSPSPAAIQCGTISVDIHNHCQLQLLDNCKLNTDTAREDLLSLLAVLDRWLFHVDCPDYSLGNVPGWIQRTFQCERLDISPQYLLAQHTGPAGPMMLHWHQTTPFQGGLAVYCSQLQVLQFLDHLCGFLPASCSIHPLRERQGEGSAHFLALSLEREVLSLKDGVASILSGEEQEERKVENRDEVSDPSHAEGAESRRAEWKRDLERSRRRLSPLVSVKSYCRLTQLLAQEQLEGDRAVLLEYRRACFSSDVL